MTWGAVHGVAGRFIASAGARLVVLPLTGLCSVLTAHALTGGYGPSAYALFLLVGTLPFLFPTPDLGLGAALMTAAARLPTNAPSFVDVRRRVNRWLRFAGLLAASLCIVVAGAGLWGPLIGTRRTDLEWPVAAALIAFAASIVWAGGASVLIGRGKNHLVTWLQAIVPLCTYLVAAGGAALHAPLTVLVGCSTIGLPISSIACAVAARRDPAVRAAIDQPTAPATRAPVLGLAIPMLIIIICTALTIQPGRLILSHTGSDAQVAELTAAYALFLPLLSVVQTAGRSFWPTFANARAQQEDLRPIVRVGLRLTAAIGVGAAIGLTVLGPPVARWSTRGLVATPVLLYAVLGVIVLVVALHQVNAMCLNEESGLRFQSGTTLAAMVAALALGIALAPGLGALGVTLALLVGFGLVQAVPSALRVRRALVRTP